jgi:hypothetical protein
LVGLRVPGLGNHGVWKCAACGIELQDPPRDAAERAFMIAIQDFQDLGTLIVKTLMKCCVTQITPHSRLIPFCAYNSVGNREQVREHTSGVPVADFVPNAAPIQALLAPSPYG